MEGCEGGGGGERWGRREKLSSLLSLPLLLFSRDEQTFQARAAMTRMSAEAPSGRSVAAASDFLAAAAAVAKDEARRGALCCL